MYSYLVNYSRYLLFSIVAAISSPLAAQSIQTPVTPPVNGAIVFQRGGEFHSGDDRFQLRMESDGNFKLHFGSNILWSANTGPRNVGNWPLVERVEACQVQFQYDGNLVVMAAKRPASALPPCSITTYADWFPIWSSNTYGNNGAILDVQNDGNVIIKKSNGQVLWTSNTCCH